MFDNISNNFHARDSEQWNLIQIYGIGSENYAVSLNDALGQPAGKSTTIILNINFTLFSDLKLHLRSLLVHRVRRQQSIDFHSQHGRFFRSAFRARRRI